jgi:hypothetical protein
MVINQSMKGKFEGIWLKLLFEIYYNHGSLVVIVFFKVRHARILFAMPNFIKKCLFFGVFIQLQRLKHRLGEVGGFFGTKKVTDLPSPRALTC